MKKWIPVLAVLLGGSVGLATPLDKLICVNGDQQSLEIAQDPEAATVAALFKSETLTQNFDGAISPGGRFAMNPTAANEHVTLDLVRPRDHGGRCGRCAIDGVPLALNAQLAVGSEIFVFQCFP
jgi:hypothetical protein